MNGHLTSRSAAPAVDPLMRAMLDASPLGVLEYELRGDELVLVRANAAASRIVGIDCTLLLGRTLEQAFPGLEPTDLPAAYRAVARGAPPLQRAEFPYRSGGVDGIYEMFVFQSGTASIAVMFRDVAPERRAAQAIAESEARFAAVFRGSPDSITVVRLDDHTLVDVNPAFERVTGVSRSEAIGRRALDLGLWADPEQRRELMRRLEQADYVVDYEFTTQRRGQPPLPAMLSSYRVKIGGIPHIVSVTREISAERRAEMERAANAERMRRIFDLIPEPVAVLENTTGRYLDVNRAWSAAFGYQRDEVIGRSALDFGLWPAGTESRRSELMAELARGGELAGVAVRYLRKDRRLVDILLSAALIDMPEGKVGIWVGRDVTEERRLQAALAASEARLRRVFELFPEPVGIIDHTSGRYLDVNRAWERVYGWPREQVRGKTTLDLGMWPEVAHRAPLLARVSAERELSGVEVQYRRSDGQLIDAELSAALVDTPDGPIGIWVGRDITESKRLRAIQRASEERLATMFRMAPAAMALTSRDGARFIDVNDAWLAMFGYQRAELVGAAALEVALYLDRSQRTELLLAIERLGRIDRREIMLRRRDGALVHVLLSAQRFDLHDQPAILWSGLDISDRKRAEQTLRESEQRLRAVVRSAPVVLTVLDRAGVIRISEGQGLAALGLQPGELIGRAAHELYADQPALLAAVRRALGGAAARVTVETGGTVADVQFAPLADSFGSIDGAISVAVNVTERVAAERALADSEARFAAMFNQSPVPMAVADPVSDRCEAVNEAFLQLFGFARDEVIGATSAELRLFADPAQRQDLLEQARARAYESLQSVARIMRCKDGSLRWCEVTGRALSIGGQAKLLWAVQDVTARREAEHRLRNTVAQLQTVIMAAPVVLFALDRDGRCTLFEGRALQDIGLTPSQVLGRAADEVYRDAPGVLAALQPALAGSQHSARIQLGGRSFALFCQPLQPDAAGRHSVIGVMVDLTEQLRAEEALQRLNEQLERRVAQRTAALARAGEELMRVEKLAALGRLVAGVAHELNTPIGNSVLVASSLADATRELESAVGAGLRRSALADYLSQASASAQLLQRNLQRAGDLIASFKQVAVDQTSMQRREFDLAEVLQENVTALMPSIRALQHKVEIDAPAGIRMDSYPGPLGQVLTNLINNAMQHAFEGRDPGSVRVTAAMHGADEVRIEARDDGRGIAPAHLARIFDPFFTTRLGKGGSGLGLNIVHNLVTGVLGGSIDVSSRPEAGTTFTLLLPRVAPPLRAPTPADDSLLH